MITCHQNHEDVDYLQKLTLHHRERGDLLPSAVKEKMENAFGHDFSNIRIFQGKKSTQCGVAACAFGGRLYFASGCYDPWSVPGQLLIGHELAHVVQQRKRVNPLTITAYHALEWEADWHSLCALLGFPVHAISGCKTDREGYRIDCPSPLVQYSVKGFTTLTDLINELKKNTPPFSLDSPLARRFLNDILTDLGREWTVEEIRSLQPKDVEDYAARKIQHAFRVSKSFKQIVNLDQIQNRYFSMERREKLKKIGTDLYLAEQYGLQTVKDHRDLSRQLGLRFYHKNSTIYLRDSFADAEGLFKDIEKLFQDKDEYKKFTSQTGYEYFFVNSPFMMEKLTTLSDSFLTDMECFSMGTGICKLKGKLTKTCKKFWGTNIPSSVAGYLMKSLGATPSSYQAIKILHQQDSELTDTDNLKLLNQILQSQDFLTVKKFSTEEDNSLRWIHCSVVKLIEGLDKMQAILDTKQDIFKRSSVIMNALDSIKIYAGYFALNRENALNTTRLYELFINELYMILAVTHPYSLNHFLESAAAVLKTRIPTLIKEKLETTISLASSGMDALTTALAAALTLHHDKKTVQFVDSDQDYFEMTEIVQFANCTIVNSPQDEASILIASLNSSSPTLPSDTQQIVDLTNSQCKKTKYVTLLIDSTIETDSGEQGQLNCIIAGLSASLQDGSLNIILAKSYQKYASLGTARIMSGMTVAIQAAGYAEKYGKCTDFIKKANEAKMIELDENQLMTFILRYAADDELALIQTAVKNTKFVQAFCWPDQYRNVKQIPNDLFQELIKRQLLKLYYRIAKVPGKFTFSKETVWQQCKDVIKVSVDIFLKALQDLRKIPCFDFPSFLNKLGLDQQDQNIVDSMERLLDWLFTQQYVETFCQGTEKFFTFAWEKELGPKFPAETAELKKNLYNFQYGVSVGSLPFLLKFYSQYTIGTTEYSLVKIVSLMDLELRDSFSFLNSSYLDVNDRKWVRINVGQESAARLTEIFYAVGQLLYEGQKREMEPKGKYITYTDVMGKIQSAEKTNLYKENLIASCLHFISIFFIQTNQLSPKQKSEVNQVYTKYFKTSFDPLSPEMRGTLVLDWLQLLLSLEPNSEKEIVKEFASTFSDLLPFLNTVPGYRRTLVFYKEISEKIFVQLPSDQQKELTKKLLWCPDLTTAQYIGKEIVANGELEKTRQMAGLVCELYRYQITDESILVLQNSCTTELVLLIQSLTGKVYKKTELWNLIEEKICGQCKLERTKYPTESEFFDAVRKVNPQYVITDSVKKIIFGVTIEKPQRFVDEIVRELITESLEEIQDLEKKILELITAQKQTGISKQEEIKEIQLRITAIQVRKSNAQKLQIALAK